MSRHNRILIRHKDGASRCRQLCDLYKYGKTKYPKTLDSSDILRSCVVMMMSSLDLLVHSIYVNEVRHRLSSRIPVKNLLIPFNCLVSDPSASAIAVNDHISNSHSYKSFIAPDKISEVICHFVENPWSQIAARLKTDEKQLKTKLKELVRWRNRIAHEADVNPALGGVELWPILEEDVREAVDFIEILGEMIIITVTEAA